MKSNITFNLVDSRKMECFNQEYFQAFIAVRSYEMKSNSRVPAISYIMEIQILWIPKKICELKSKTLNELWWNSDLWWLSKAMKNIRIFKKNVSKSGLLKKNLHHLWFYYAYCSLLIPLFHEFLLQSKITRCGYPFGLSFLCNDRR